MPQQEFDWPPEHHLGAIASISHADETIGHMSDILFEYQTNPQGILSLSEVREGEISRTIVSSIAPLPRKVPLLASDALNTLRNALEHALFAEIEHREGPLSEKAARLVEIPAAKTWQDFQNWIKTRAKNGLRSLSPGSSLLCRLESLQPFQRVQDPENHPLAVLVSHTNHAKHRTPAVTAVRLPAMYRDDRRPNSINELPRRPETPVHVGEVIAENPVGQLAPVTLFPSIGIHRPETDRWPILMTELDQISVWVRTQALPLLIAGQAGILPELPASYDISSGHDDERAAAALGGVKTASQRHADRLAAASARIDMGDLLGHLSDAPPTDQIRAWLTSLSDEEVLAWVGRLQMAKPLDLGAASSNLKIIADMRDEASGFRL